MRHSLHLFAMVAIIATVFTFTAVRRASAASCVIVDITAQNSISAGGPVEAFHTYTLTLFDNGAVYPGFPQTFTPVINGSWSSILTLIGHTVRLLFVDNSAGCPSQAVTFFNPGDGRLNGEPWDRLVVYCNANQTPPNIDVWAIDNSSVGHELAKLPLADLVAAGSHYSKNLGADGVLFAGSDATGNGYAALQGGPYNGTATGDWLKTFNCTG